MSTNCRNRITLRIIMYPDRFVPGVQHHSVHDVVAAAGRGALPYVLRDLTVHGARRAELRTDDWRRIQCCCEYSNV